MAIERRNPAWEDATNDQITRLWHKRADLCPKYGRERTRLARALEKIRAVQRDVGECGPCRRHVFLGRRTALTGPAGTFLIGRCSLDTVDSDRS